MGTLFSSLNIALSGMSVAQVQLDTAAHNITNANTDGYSRQRVEQSSRLPITRQYGQIGRGVQINGIERIRDPFLDYSFRLQSPGLGSAEVEAEYYRLIDGVFLEPGENGFGTRLGQFFDALNDFADNVESFPVREALVSETRQLSMSMNEVAERFYILRTNANEEVRNIVPEINSLTSRIGELNQRIVNAELNKTSANDLRDERDRLLDELSRYVNITTTETNNMINVLIGNDAVVEGTLVSELEAVRNPSLDPEREDLVEVRFVGSSRVLQVRGGELHGALQVRDEILPLFDGRMDQLAAAVIEAINSIHNQGNGINNLSGTISSTNDVSAATDPLVSAGLPFTVTPGTFDLVVYDAAGNASTTTITITAATTLNDLATALNGVANFSASVVGEQIDLGSAAGFTFSFANDNSGVLTALGINGLFTGYDARTIAVNEDLANDPNLISSGYSLDVLETGDNTLALAMANVRNVMLLDSNSATLDDYYEATVARLGVDSRANNASLNVQRAFVQDFDQRRQEVSGVSLDEETAHLIQFQRAFEASARVMTVTDRMLDALLGMAI